MTISTLTNEQLKYYANATCGGTRGDAGIMARELLAVREAQSLWGIRVGNLPTMNQDEYPGLPAWWVQLRIGTDGDEVLARIYGSTPHEAMMRARAIAAPPALPSEQLIGIANHMASAAGGLPSEWQDWADEIVSDLRRLASIPALSVPEDVAAALDWIDDFIARCNGDDRGSCNSVNVLRAAMLQPVSQGYTLNSPVIPDGWKLVPNEPTAKQWAAGYKAMEGGIDKVTLAYRAMVEVAPSPGGPDDSHATAT